VVFVVVTALKWWYFQWLACPFYSIHTRGYSYRNW